MNMNTKTKKNGQVRAVWEGIEVRRNNGRCGYGLWKPAGHGDVPHWVWEYVADEIAENGIDAGQVERGGSRWDWRVCA
jgi:hypothetical protein